MTPRSYPLLTWLGSYRWLPVQHYVNRLNALTNPTHDRNNRFTAWNWVGIIVGGSFMLLVISASFALLTEP